MGIGRKWESAQVGIGRRGESAVSGNRPLVGIGLVSVLGVGAVKVAEDQRGHAQARALQMGVEAGSPTLRAISAHRIQNSAHV